MNNTITLKLDDGTTMNAYTSQPAEKKKYPGIILLQEAFGVNSHIRNVADRLAREGYVVIAPELFHRTAPAGYEASYTDMNAIMAHFQALTIPGFTSDLNAVYQWLQSQDEVIKEKIGAIGFCLGGRVTFLANALLPLSAAVSYYGGGIPALFEYTKDLHAPHLFFWGGKDTRITQDQVASVIAEMDKEKKEYINVIISYADHAFNCDERANYHPQAAKEAWPMTLSFLQNKLKG